MHVKLKKGQKVSEMFTLNGINPEEYLIENDADEIHIMAKNGSYMNSKNIPVQKWRVKDIIKNPKNTMNNNHNNPGNSLTIFNEPEQLPSLPSSQIHVATNLEAARMQIMYLNNHNIELRNDLKRYKDKFEFYKAESDKKDRELLETRLQHKEDLRDLKDENTQGLNGLIQNNPDVFGKIIDSALPTLMGLLSKKVEGSNENKEDQSIRADLKSFIQFSKSLDTQDPNFVNTCIALAHVYSSNKAGFEGLKENINNQLQKQ